MSNIKPLYLYFISLVCFILANVLKDKVNFAHGFFLGLGVIVFLYALYVKFNSK